VQEKTGIKIWVPLHKRLRKYLAGLPRRGKHILMSPVTGKRYAKRWRSNARGSTRRHDCSGCHLRFSASGEPLRKVWR
jgi:hypothetical protein